MQYTTSGWVRSSYENKFIHFFTDHDDILCMVFNRQEISMKYSLLLIVLALTSGCAQLKGDPGKNGQDGSIGLQGTKGIQGVNGQDCSVQQATVSVLTPYGGAIVTCGSSSVLITNGMPGAQGVPGPVTTYGIDKLIDPCGATPGIYNEVFLRLANGQLIWSLSDNANGQNTRLALAADGNWVTTDGSNCTFSISTNGNIRTIIWPNYIESWNI